MPGALMPAWGCSQGGETGPSSQFPLCFSSTPRQAVHGSPGMLEETSRAGSPCCNPAALFHTAGPMEQGVHRAIPSPAALRVGAGEAGDRLGPQRYFPATLATSGVAMLLVAAVDALTVSVLAGPGCQSERCSSSKSCAECECWKRGRGKV